MSSSDFKKNFLFNFKKGAGTPINRLDILGQPIYVGDIIADLKNTSSFPAKKLHIVTGVSNKAIRTKMILVDTPKTCHMFREIEKLRVLLLDFDYQSSDRIQTVYKDGVRYRLLDPNNLSACGIAHTKQLKIFTVHQFFRYVCREVLEAIQNLSKITPHEAHIKLLSYIPPPDTQRLQRLPLIRSAYFYIDEDNLVIPVSSQGRSSTIPDHRFVSSIVPEEALLASLDSLIPTENVLNITSVIQTIAYTTDKEASSASIRSLVQSL